MDDQAAQFGSPRKPLRKTLAQKEKDRQQSKAELERLKAEVRAWQIIALLLFVSLGLSGASLGMCFATLVLALFVAAIYLSNQRGGVLNWRPNGSGDPVAELREAAKRKPSPEGSNQSEP